MTTMLERPASTEYAHYYERYIGLVPDGDILSFLRQQRGVYATLLGGLSEAQGNHRYAPGKWCIKELVCHVADAERVFSYRALHFARGDQAPLPSFDESQWAPYSGAAERTLRSMAEEFDAVRGASLALIGSFTPEQLVRHGIASGMDVSVRALAWKIGGHAEHHLNILRERYLAK